jgi:voltage-gated potassium channel Kch
MTAATAGELQTPPPRQGLPSIARRLWRDYRLLITGLVAVAAMVLGIIGFSLQETSWSVGARLYATVGLFHLYTASTKPPNNIYLQVAQWLAPATVGYAAFLALADVFSRQATVFRVSFMRGHVVICGLGRCGIRLARSFRKGAYDRPAVSVVVIDRNPTAADRRECRDLGIPVLTGDARDIAVLQQAGMERASHLIAVCGNDAVDSEVASAALSLVGSKRNRTPLRCFIHIGDHQLSEQLEKLALEVPAEGEAQLSQFEWFNVYRLGPIALLNSDLELLKPRDGQSPHVIVVGAGLLGRNLVTETARRWSLGQHPTSIRITLIASDAQDQCTTLKAQFPHLPYVCDLVAISVDAAAIRSVDQLTIDLPSSHSRTKAFVCVADDDECLRATIQIREALPEEIDVVTCTTGSSGIATFLRNKTGGILSRVQEFALLDIALTPEVLLDTVKEQIAQALHADYVEDRRQHPQLDDAHVRAVVPWERLPESFRQANRAKASGIGLQLAELGFKLVRNDAWRAPALLFSQAQVLELAKHEHSRWMEQKKRDGWHLATRNDDKKLNPYLVDWEHLPKDIQEIDCAFARRLPAILASFGYSIVHKQGSPTRVESSPVATSL